VVPVPTVLKKGQIHIGDKAVVDHLDQFSAPRLVEYFDPDPCPRYEALARDRASAKSMTAQEASGGMARLAPSSVIIEARYTIGEYDILLLSAKSRGLELAGRRQPLSRAEGAARVLEASQTGHEVLASGEPQGAKAQIQSLPQTVACESEVHVPVQLGMVNSSGRAVHYALAPAADQSVNYHGKTASDMIFGQRRASFPEFYRAIFGRQVGKDDMSVVYTEYAWDMGWCDPCAARPLAPEELKQLGVWWLDDAPEPGTNPTPFVTRLHVRYDREHFPQDLVFQETADRTNFQARYVLRHEWTGAGDCANAREYRLGLPKRREKEARTLAELTGWSVERIRGDMNLQANWTRQGERFESVQWWERVWKD
jgi:hypothetical protein